MKDIIRLGKFSDLDCEKLRLEIVKMDCGFSSCLIKEANKDLQNITDINEVKEILANYLHEIRGELGH